MKEKDFNFYVLNLPIVGNQKENTELYEDFFKQIFKQKKPIIIAKDRAAILRTMYFSEGRNNIIYGNISTFTKVGKDWLNIDRMEKESFEIPKNMFPNLRETYYFFIPKYHRFVLMKMSNGVTLNNALKYFINLKTKGFSKYDFDVHYEVSKDAIKEILTADIVKSLKLTVSFSNADIGDAAFHFVDSELKKSNTQVFEINAKSFDAEGIEINKSKILKGSLELSKSYGKAEASIIKNNKKKRVKTEDYPYILKLKGKIGEFQKLYNNVFHTLKEYLRDE